VIASQPYKSLANCCTWPEKLWDEAGKTREAREGRWDTALGSPVGEVWKGKSEETYMSVFGHCKYMW